MVYEVAQNYIPPPTGGGGGGSGAGGVLVVVLVLVLVTVPNLLAFPPSKVSNEAAQTSFFPL